MNLFRERGTAVASAKICRPRRSPTTRSSSPTTTIIRVVAGIRDRLGSRMGTISPGISAISAWGRGISACGSDATAAIWAARLAPAEWPIKANRPGSGRTCPTPS